MISDRFWELVSKQAFSEATDAELKELDQFVSSHPDLENIANSLNALCLHSLPAEKTNDL